jgi:hypothetical protein
MYNYIYVWMGLDIGFRTGPLKSQERPCADFIPTWPALVTRPDQLRGTARPISVGLHRLLLCIVWETSACQQ